MLKLNLEAKHKSQDYVDLVNVLKDYKLYIELHEKIVKIEEINFLDEPSPEVLVERLDLDLIVKIDVRICSMGKDTYHLDTPHTYVNKMSKRSVLVE